MIRQTNKVGLVKLFHYMESGGRVPFDNECLEALTFLAHAFREWTAQKYTTIKQKVFARTQARVVLGGGIEAIKGAYQSLRVVHAAGALKGRLSLNIDVANTAFWSEGTLLNVAIALTGARDTNDLVVTLQKQGEKGRAATELKKMKKLHVVASHRGTSTTDKYVIERFVYQSARKYKFEKDGEMISIYDYFAKSFNIRLNYDLPLAKMTKGKNVSYSSVQNT